MNLRILLLLGIVIISCQEPKPEAKLDLGFVPLQIDLSNPQSIGEAALKANDMNSALNYYSKEGKTPYEKYILSSVFIKMEDYFAALSVLKYLIDSGIKEDWIQDAQWNYIVCNKKLKRWGAHVEQLKTSICIQKSHKHYRKCNAL